MHNMFLLCGPDKVHVATWGSLDWIKETVQMTLAIPGQSLKDLLGLTKVPDKYYLKVCNFLGNGISL